MCWQKRKRGGVVGVELEFGAELRSIVGDRRRQNACGRGGGVVGVGRRFYGGLRRT